MWHLLYSLDTHFLQSIITGVRKGKERSTAIYRKPNCATLVPCHDVYRCTCIHEWRILIDNGWITGPWSRQEVFARQAYPFVTKEHTLRISWSNSSTSSSSSYTWLTFLFVSLRSFAFGFSWAWAAAAIVVSRLSTPFNGFALKWSFSSTTMTRGTYQPILLFVTSELSYGYQNMEVFETCKAAEFSFG